MHAAAYELTQARLATYLSASPKLPRGVSVHCLVGRAEARDAEITLYATVWPPGEDAAEVAAAALAPYGEPFFVGYDGVYPYSQVPPPPPPRSPPLHRFTSRDGRCARPAHQIHPAVSEPLACQVLSFIIAQLHPPWALA